MNLLCKIFNGRILNSEFKCPQRSPDLSSPDVFLKSRAYVSKSEVFQLHNNIPAEIRELVPETFC